jgi:hypothetical protein
VQQRLRRRAADGADGRREYEADAAEQRLRLRRRHSPRELAPRHLAQNIRHALGRRREDDRAPGGGELQVAVDAELHLPRRAALAFLRLEAQPHGVVQHI